MVLTFSHFALAKNLDIHNVCEAHGSSIEKVQKKLIRKSCLISQYFRGMLALVNTKCSDESKASIESLKKNEWTQKQLNYISFYILRDKQNKDRIDQNLYEYILENHPEPPFKNSKSNQ